ncbi:MAG TPA: YihY/virulence factor BrkB family protein [Bacteroidales bacterium]|nr:YihY/virulence factor BrkB family protein [Bacteroidales bacterium]
MGKLQKTLRFLWVAGTKFKNDNGFFLSSGIAFNILINLIPFMILLLALIGSYLYKDQEVLVQIRAYLRNVAPTIDPKIMRSLIDVIRDRQTIGILGFAGLIWFSTWIFSSLQITFDIVFGVTKPRTTMWAIAIDLFMVGVVGILFLVNMVLSSLFAVLQNQGWILAVTEPAIRWILKYLLPFLLTVCMFFLIFKIIPTGPINFTSAMKVSLFTSMLWELAKHLFGWYVANIASYSIFYGSLSALAIFVLWVYYSSTILVMGGELLYVLERDRRKLDGMNGINSVL